VIQNLNIPEYEHRYCKKEGVLYIYDIIRKKYIRLTPEEWVRQQFICWLVEQYQYPKTLMQVEKGHQYQKKQKRTDLVVYNRKGNPWMLVECKAMDIAITTKVLEQAALYNKTVQAKYITVVW
jgi:hypothetical protein